MLFLEYNLKKLKNVNNVDLNMEKNLIFKINDV